MVCNFGALRRAGGLDGGQGDDHGAGVNTRIGRLNVGKGGIDNRFPDRDSGIFVRLPVRIDMRGHTHFDLAIVRGFGESRRFRKHARSESPDIPEGVVFNDTVRQETDLINGVQDIPRASMRADFLSGKPRDALGSAVVAREGHGKSAIRIRDIPFSPGGIVQIFVSGCAVIAVVHGGSEIEADRACRRFDVLVDGHLQVEARTARGLREAQAGDQGQSEKNG